MRKFLSLLMTLVFAFGLFTATSAQAAEKTVYCKMTQSWWASGGYSHAEGKDTKALAYYAHSEGWLTSASGQYSHAEGQQSYARGQASHAEGLGNYAVGSNSHAEGNGTHASGSCAHSEGSSTRAIGNNSHAEGGYTYASGTWAHAEGNRTIAYANYSHTEGEYTTASGLSSHAEGYYTVTNNDYEHAQGRYNATASSQIFSVGVGSAEANRKNAISVITGSGAVSSASVYIYGVGGYDGTNPQQGVNDVATVLSESGRNYEVVTNKVTTLTSASTDDQYPSAKCVYDILEGIENVLNIIIVGSDQA